MLFFLRFYNDDFTCLRFLNYIVRHRAYTEMIHIFVTGGNKCLKREFKQTGRDTKRGNLKKKEKEKKVETIRTT